MKKVGIKDFEFYLANPVSHDALQRDIAGNIAIICKVKITKADVNPPNTSPKVSYMVFWKVKKNE